MVWMQNTKDFLGRLHNLVHHRLHCQVHLIECKREWWWILLEVEEELVPIFCNAARWEEAKIEENKRPLSLGIVPQDVCHCRIRGISVDFITTSWRVTCRHRELWLVGNMFSSEIGSANIWGKATRLTWSYGLRKLALEAETTALGVKFGFADWVSSAGDTTHRWGLPALYLKLNISSNAPPLHLLCQGPPFSKHCALFHSYWASSACS